MPASFHFVSLYGNSLPLAVRFLREGARVTFACEHAPTVGKGLIPLSKAPEKNAIIVFDSIGYSAAKYPGHVTIGGNTIEDALESNRSTGERLARAAGLRTPPTYPFRSPADAMKFLEKVEGEWFVKVNGSDSGEDATMGPGTSEELSRYLKWATKNDPSSLVVQQKVDGTEVSINGWFDGERFIHPLDVTIEEKKFLTGDLGPRTGCESCVVFHGGESLGKQTVLKMEHTLREAGYVGLLDTNVIVTEDGEPYFLEFTARFGYDALQAWARLFVGPLHEQVEAFALGKLDEWKPGPDPLSAVLRVTIPPYPNWNEAALKKTQGLPIEIPLYDTFVDILDVQEGPVVVGNTGIVCTVGAVGDRVSTLQAELLERAESLGIPRKQYRVDPLSRVVRDLRELEKHAEVVVQWKE